MKRTKGVTAIATQICAGKGLSQNTLKWIACISMAVDHIGYTFFPNAAVLRIIGRLAFPLFAFFIYEGCIYTRDIQRYFLRVFGLGAVCFVAYAVFSGSFFGNVLLTFSCSILIIGSSRMLFDALQSTKKAAGQIAKGLTAFALSIGTLILAKRSIGLDFGTAGVLLPVFPYWFRRAFPQNESASALLGFCFELLLLCLCKGGIQAYCLFSVPLLLFYSGERGKGNPWLFYLFYPAHLAIIGALSLLVQ